MDGCSQSWRKVAVATTCVTLACCLTLTVQPLPAQTRLPAVEMPVESAGGGFSYASATSFQDTPAGKVPTEPGVTGYYSASAAHFQVPPTGETASTELSQRLARLEQNQQRLEQLLDSPTEQDSPAAAYNPPYEPLPSYYYSRSYYQGGDGGSARPLADYAPPGYQPREQQEGPAVPEYTRLTPPTRLSAEDQGSFVSRGMYPGSFLVPGTNTSVRLRGFVRLAALYDLDPIGSTDSFVTNTIPVPQQTGQNYNMSGRISRFALETWTPTTFHDWSVRTFIEGDFINGAAQAAGGGGNPLRLRHAYFDFGFFRFGQQNTVFMDGTNWPSLVDFQGPNSWTNQRQPSARMTIPLAQRWFWATSVERSFSDITTSDMGSSVQDIPDFATHLRYQGDLGHLQVAGLVRSIGYWPTGGEVERHTGSGISGNAVFHPWAMLLGTNPLCDHESGLTRSRILLQGTWGSGISRYMNDLAAQRLDGQVNPVTGEFDLVEATGWNASYEHWFNERWLSNFTFADVSVDNNADQPGGTYAAATYLAASLWWIPVPRLSLAIEYMNGQRENLDGQNARVERLHALAQYNF